MFERSLMIKLNVPALRNNSKNDEKESRKRYNSKRDKSLKREYKIDGRMQVKLFLNKTRELFFINK